MSSVPIKPDAAAASSGATRASTTLVADALRPTSGSIANAGANAPGTSNARPNAARTRRRTQITPHLSLVGLTAGVLLLFLLSLLVATAIIERMREDIRLSASILVLSAALVILGGIGAAARELTYWRRSCRNVARLANELRAGTAPLAELDALTGGARVLIEPMRAILLDLREQKRINLELQEEMRTRILNRTDALERQLGTLKAQAARDALTGLNNRRAFDAVLPQIFAACRSSREDLCALMIDVDNFKPLNDTLGHAAGDELLKAIGEIIRSSIREHDTAFRVGGDEFVILLPRASGEIGKRLADRLASLVDHLARPMRLPHPPGLSIGVAALSSEASVPDAKALISTADRRLYEVKQSKPNRHQRSVA